MNMFLPLMVFISVQIVRSVVYMDENGVEFEYKIDYNKRCSSRDGRFSFYHGLAIVQCVKECGLRRHCAALNYKTRLKVCELFAVEKEGNDTEAGCIFMSASDIKVLKLPCGVCDEGKVCDTKSKACIYKDCDAPSVIENGKIFGGHNYKIGQTIRYRCNNVEVFEAVNAVCLPNGQWSKTLNCTKACGPLPGIANGIVSVPMTTHGAIATYTCNVDYGIMAGDPTRLCDTGIWTGIEPSCTPTPNRGCYIAGFANLYQGTRQTTAAGITCQRWDSQSPHSHTRNMPAMFPDTSVSAAENYCRDPDAAGTPWCYTVNLDKRWAFCGLEQC